MEKSGCEKNDSGINECIVRPDVAVDSRVEIGSCNGAATMGTKLSFIKRFEKMGIKYKRSLQKCLYRCECITVLLSCNG